MANTMNTRRTFLKNTSASVAGATMLGTGVFSAWANPIPVQGDLTIQQVIDQIIATIPGGKVHWRGHHFYGQCRGDQKGSQPGCQLHH